MILCGAIGIATFWSEYFLNTSEAVIIEFLHDSMDSPEGKTRDLHIHRGLLILSKKFVGSISVLELF